MSDRPGSLDQRLRAAERAEEQRRRGGRGYTEAASDDARLSTSPIEGPWITEGTLPTGRFVSTIAPPPTPGYRPNLTNPGQPPTPGGGLPGGFDPAAPGGMGPTFEPPAPRRTVGDWRPFERRPKGPRGRAEAEQTFTGGTAAGTTLEQTFKREPIGDVLQRLYQMDRNELEALQLKMYDAGFYGGEKLTNVVLRAVDDSTFEAFVALLEATERENDAGVEVTWGEYLDNVQRLRREQGTNFLDQDGREKRDPLTVRVTSPADIERVVRETAIDLTGQAPDDAWVARQVARYQGAEAGAQRAAYDMQPTGGTVAAPPDLGTFAAEQVEQADPLAVAAYRGADQVMAAFDDIVGGSFDG